MNAIRRLLTIHGLLPDASPNALHDALNRLSPAGAHPPVTPWSIRAAAHERSLTNDEIAVALGHIARHRGFKSNAKSQGANAADETSKMKKAMERTREGLAQYRSFGEMLAQDSKFAERKRNREGDFSHTPFRADLEAEARAIFAAQRRLGNAGASAALEEAYCDATTENRPFHQRPLQDSESLVGKCPFETGEMRTARRAPSFEMFRYLQRLNTLELSVGREKPRRLTAAEVRQAADAFGSTKTITFNALRKLLDIDPNARFSAPETDKKGKDLDVVARTGGAAYGTKTLRDSIGEAAWKSLGKTPEKLDRIAEVISFREDLDSIRKGLEAIGLDGLIVDKLVEDAEAGVFNDFTRSGHVSALACRNILPGLLEGLVYSEACERAGYDHAARAATSIRDVNSPVTRRAFLEAMKQVKAIEREYGPIDRVHIELARAVGKSAEERKKLKDGLEERTAEKERRRADAAEILGRPVSDDELLRYELAKEQGWKCVYSGDAIAPGGFAANDLRYQVDHILPWSRFGDDSYLNKTLCATKANQEKRERTPYEWFLSNKSENEWSLYEARVESLKEVKGRKKRNYLLKNATDIEEKFKARNLTDTQWVTRLIADELRRAYPPRPERENPDGTDERRVFTRPGAITSKLRRAWCLEDLKKIDGERVSDDRHHAVDALVLAACTEGLLQRMTKEIQKREKEGRTDDIFHVAQPWPGFRMDVRRAVYGENGAGGVFVSRAERRRARGKAHDATIKQVRGADGKKLFNTPPSQIEGERLVYERKSVLDLKEADLDRIPVPSPYGKIADPQKLRDEMVATLRDWLKLPLAERKKNPPRSPRGDPIRKVRLLTKDKVAVEVNKGTADRSDMTRVDVFQTSRKSGKPSYFLVPIYPYQVADGKRYANAPNRAIMAHKDEEYWPVMDQSFGFLFSLTLHDYIEVVKSNGEVIEGYYKGIDRASSSITVADHKNILSQVRGIGSKTLSSFKKGIIPLTHV